jgi:hypothetical protein
MGLCLMQLKSLFQWMHQGHGPASFYSGLTFCFAKKKTQTTNSSKIIFKQLKFHHENFYQNSADSANAGMFYLQKFAGTKYISINW